MSKILRLKIILSSSPLAITTTVMIMIIRVKLPKNQSKRKKEWINNLIVNKLPRNFLASMDCDQETKRCMLIWEEESFNFKTNQKDHIEWFLNEKEFYGIKNLHKFLMCPGSFYLPGEHNILYIFSFNLRRTRVFLFLPNFYFLFPLFYLIFIRNNLVFIWEENKSIYFIRDFCFFKLKTII